jgi:release factor glutamine methyltransferase
MQTIAAAIVTAETRLSPNAGDDATLEAQVLLADALGISRTSLLARLSEPLPSSASKQFEASLARRLQHEPLAYIVGHREFYGIEFMCSPVALIPRPETEMLVDFALEEVANREGTIVIADIGTGTGAVTVAVALNAPGASMVAVDRSRTALKLARQNANHSSVNGISFIQTDLLGGLRKFDVILANLPYVAEDEWHKLPREIREFEPREALVGGATGIELISYLLAEAPHHLRPGAVVALEIGAEQGATLRAVTARIFPDAAIHVRKDLAGLDRVLEVRT